MPKPHDRHARPPPSSQSPKALDTKVAAHKKSVKPCISGHCDKRPAPAKLEHRTSSGTASSCWCSGCSRSETSHSSYNQLVAEHSIIHCMLCDTSGHSHGTVRLIFEPQVPFLYHQGQILQVLLPDDCGPEILITSNPGQSAVMHGTLQLASGKPLPAQFGPDAAFGLMFEVCAPKKWG